MIKYVLSLILLFPFAAYAGGNKHNITNNTTNNVTNNASQGGSAKASSGDVTVLGGGAVGIGGSWKCGDQYGIGGLFFSLAWTSDNEFCRLGYQMARVCEMAKTRSDKEARCRELQDRFAAWEPAKSQEVSTAAE